MNLEPPAGEGVLVRRDGPVLRVTIHRPSRLNALTMGMYTKISEACDSAARSRDDESPVRLLLLTGAGGSFSTGTDIRTFLSFRDGADGVAYERRVSAVCDRVMSLAVPTVAMIRGHCFGGGMLLAAACDLRVAADSARFGYPFSQTIGNCLSARSLELISSRIGATLTDDLVLRARVLGAKQAHRAGFLSELCADDDLESRTGQVVSTLLSRAPLSQWAIKELRRRSTASVAETHDEDVIERVYGSSDFHHGVRAFLAKEDPRWEGR